MPEFPRPEFEGLDPDVALPDEVREELEVAQENWFADFGSVGILVGFTVLGRVTANTRYAVVRWIAEQSPILQGNVMAAETLTFTPPFSIAGYGVDEERRRYSEYIAQNISDYDYVIETSWRDSAENAFSTLTIASPDGIRYDSVLSNAIVHEEIFVPASERETDTFHRNFGWIWQRRGNFTRGYVEFKLTAVCSAEMAAYCSWSKECAMSFGSSSVEITPNPPTPSGTCCSLAYAWAVATAVIDVAVANGLAITVKGRFGSIATGAGSLRDCCR